MVDKEKYKLSEVGEIPKDWDVVILGDKASIYRGGSPRPIQNYLTKAPNGVNWIKIGDVRADEKFISSTMEKIIPEGAVHSREVCKGDFILSNSMSFGRPYILEIDGCIHDGWLVVQKYQKAFERMFLYYMLCSETTMKQYKSMAAGSSVQNLNKEKVEEIKIVQPRMNEQRTIAEALSDIDNLITSLKKLIDKKKSIKQGAMQELLTGKRRLPGFSEKWKKVKLGDCILGQPLYGVNAPAVRYNPIFPTYIRITDITEDGKFSHSDKASVIYNNYRNYLMKNSDIVLARTGASVGKSYLYNNRDGQLVYAGFLIKISINPQIANDKFVFYSLHTKKYWNWVGIVSMRSGQPGINSVEYASFEFELPSIKEQNAIIQILTDIDIEIEQLEMKLAKSKQIKQGMMQELLTGHIRLIDNGEET